jgi:outer membrane protein insertion porin family
MFVDIRKARFYNQPMKKSLAYIVLILFFMNCLGAKNLLAQSVTTNSQDQTNSQNQASNPDNTLGQPLKMQEGVSAAPAPLPTIAPEAKTVKSIDIQGNKSIGVAQVLAKIKTRVGQPYQENVVSDDIKRLYNTGHFADVQIDHEDVDGGYKIIVKLKEKPIVDEITFSKIRYYNKHFLESKMNTKKNKFLDNKTLKDDINTIEDLYKKKGLTQAKVDVETFIDETTNKATLHFIIREGYRTKIKHIYVFGNTAYSDKKIIKTIKSRWAWLFNQGYLKEDVLDEDMNRIQAFYEQNGYIDAKASYKVEPLYKGLVLINITIEEGKRYYVGDVSITGNVIFSEYDVKSNIKNMRTGNVFTHEKLEEDLSNTRNAYFDRGYISATAEESTSFNTETGKVDVKITIKEGNLAYINKVKIQGNTHTRDIVIRRELRMYPGDQFDGRQLRKSKERLRNLGYFEDVGYDIEDTDVADQKDLVVQVKEAKTGTFSFGGGYSTVDKLVGFAEVEQKNFDFANWPSFTGGGQDLKIRGQLGSTQQQAILSFTEPWVFDYPVSAGFDAFLTNITKDSSNGYAYDEKRLGGDVRLGKSFNDNLSLNSYYKLEQIKIGNMDDNVAPDLAKEEGTNVVSSTGVSLTHDYRDNPLNPTQGWLWINSADVAGGVLGGDKDFYSFQTTASYYVPIKFSERTTVLKIGGRTGVIKAYDGTDAVPIFERYFAGGEQSIRGYDERKVGPIDPGSQDAIGGETVLLGSIEYTIPIIDIIKGAVFFDTGNVWAKAKDYGTGGIKSGVGPGLRVKTPIGPINLDYGFPLNKQSDGESKSGKFYFSVSRGF